MNTLKRLTFIILLIAGASILYMIYKLADTKYIVSKNLVEKTYTNSKYGLISFFEPISHQLEYTAEKMEHISFTEWNEASLNNEVFLGLRKNPEINSIGLATNDGFEYILYKENEVWYSRTSNPLIDQKTAVKKAYIVDGNHLIEESSELIPIAHDARERPWYKGAKENYPKKHWTAPYRFNTSQKLGMSVSQRWQDKSIEGLNVTITYSFDLDEITHLLQRIKPTKNSQICLAYDNKLLVFNKKPDTIEAINLDNTPVAAYYKSLITDHKTKKFKIENKVYWGSSQFIKLSDNQDLTMSILLPEKDFLASINKLQTLLLIGFISLVLVGLMVLGLHVRQIKDQKLLIEKGEVIQEKNKEIIQSIQYAKNIQESLMPNMLQIQRALEHAFIIYLPKDIVAGDFYWVQNQHPYVLFAVGDCTGHGVPGAMISVMCQTALNRAVLEFSLLEPKEILDKTKELFLEQVGVHSQQFTDGMDISFCLLNKENNKLSWSGANTPLYIIENKSNQLKIYQPDKQPIGRFVNDKPFNQHDIQLEKGDRIYLFSDGFQDQFGGPNLKKLKPKNFKDLLLKTNKLNLNLQREALIEAFNEWKGDENQVDDVCLLCVKI
nr:SpoIIE family protein phosphatase [uncultured Brumimicrobium sp.]